MTAWVSVLTLADGSMDAALSTFTLCTIPGVAQALAEAGHRVLLAIYLPMFSMLGESQF